MTRTTDRSRRRGANDTLRMLGPIAPARTVEECFSDAERALDRIDPFAAEVALSLRSAVADAPRFTPEAMLTSAIADDYAHLDQYRAQLEGGDPLAILRAFKAALSRSLPPPAWAVDAFLVRFARYGDPARGAPSLDDLFTDRRAATASARGRRARDWRRGVALWGAVVEALHAGRASSLTTALRDVLAAKRWGIAATKARELVEAVERVQRPAIGGKPLAYYGRQVISQKRPKTRKA